MYITYRKSGLGWEVIALASKKGRVLSIEGIYKTRKIARDRVKELRVSQETVQSLSIA